MSLWLCARHHPVKGRRKRNKKHSRKMVGKCGDIDCGDEFVTVWHKLPKIEYNDRVHEIEVESIRHARGLDPANPDTVIEVIQSEDGTIEVESIPEDTHLDDLKEAQAEQIAQTLAEHEDESIPEDGLEEILEAMEDKPVEKSAVEEIDIDSTFDTEGKEVVITGSDIVIDSKQEEIEADDAET